MKKRFQSGLTGLLLGGLWGGLVGAILVGRDIYFGDSSSILGAARDWAWLAAISGLVVGFGVGTLLGTLIGVTHANQPKGTLIGLAIGLLIAVVLTYGCYDCIDPLVFAVIVSCSILGWRISSTLQARERPG